MIQIRSEWAEKVRGEYIPSFTYFIRNSHSISVYENYRYKKNKNVSIHPLILNYFDHI